MVKIGCRLKSAISLRYEMHLKEEEEYICVF